MIALEINNQTGFHIPGKKIASLLKLVQKKIKQTGKKNISLAVVSPAQIKKLNQIYRNKDTVTDVLSFEGDKTTKDLGEIIVCAKCAEVQAKGFKHSFEKEILRLVLHGYLHLSGFDHTRNKEAVKMELLEEIVLKKFYAYDKSIA